jgi:EmrB/QacA subfamily drug resistance transporter
MWGWTVAELATEPPEEPVPEARMRLTAVIVATALFMQNLDSTVIATALPAMARSFHVPPLYMSVALTSYLISLSVFIPASGWVADHFGAKPVFRGAILIFTLASLLCGLAPSLAVLVGARILQGLGGAMMLPVGRLLLLNSIKRSQMVAAMSWLTMPALVGPILGPPLGGLIVSVASWRWVFGINLPIGLMGAVAVTLFIKDIRDPGRGGRLDLAGLVWSGLAMAFLMGGLETLGRDLVAPVVTIASFAAGAVAVAGYVVHARGKEHPVLDFSLMATPTFAISVVAGGLFRVAVGAMPFLLPLLLQLSFGDTPLQSGMITFAAAAGAILMKPATKPILERVGFRHVLVWNGVIAALFIAVSATFSSAWPDLALDGVLLVGGVFRSLQFTAFNTIAYADIDRSRLSAATSLYSTLQQLSLTLGIVVGAGTLEISARLHHHITAQKSDYDVAFLLVAAISLLAVPLCGRLARDAGSRVSGHRVQS